MPGAVLATLGNGLERRADTPGFALAATPCEQAASCVDAALLFEAGCCGRASQGRVLMAANCVPGAGLLMGRAEVGLDV